MYLRYICYPVTVLGPGKRLGIWMSGCDKRCPGCMSEDLRERRDSDLISIDVVKELIRENASGIDGVTISGGEPFDQPEDLYELVEFLTDEVTKDILVYTGYSFEELDSSPDTRRVLSIIATLIEGEYVQSEDDGKGIRGSRNQRVIKNRPFPGFDYEGCARERQLFVFGKDTFAAGLRG